MRTLSSQSRKPIYFLGMVALLAIGVFGQAGLRRAIDTDNDGKADFSIFRPSNNTWYIIRSGGGIVVQAWGSADEDFMVPGDYDGDGRGDIAVWRDTTGIWYRLNSGSSTISVQAWGISGDEPVARDYDGDGATDLAVIRRSNGIMTWYIFGSTSQFFTYNWGNSTDYSAPGDYDGDGKYDIGVQRPGASPTADGTFYILKSLGGIDVVTFGQSNDLIAPGDYDGDGKTDIAVIREGSTPTSFLQWFIRPSDGSAMISRTWGVTSTDLNVQNDYDGDGKCDVAVWRNADGNFYVQRSLDGGVQVVNWGVANDFPVAAYDSH